MNSVNVLTNEKDVVKEANVVTTAKKAVVKKAIAKAVKAEKEDMKTKAAEKNETAKKETTKKEAVKKTSTGAKTTTAKKTTAAKTSVAKKEEAMGAKEEIFIQTSSNEMRLEAIVEKVKKAYVAEGNVETKDDQIRIYVKPEENMVYYVVNNSYASGINLFE